jgi:Leucine-rich repeat (LRR) protein
MYRTGDNIYITNVGLDMDEYVRKINSIEDKDNIKVFNCASNFISGKILKIPFPNLKKFNIKNNKIISIEDVLPKKLEYLFIDDNDFSELPKLPKKLKILTFNSILFLSSLGLTLLPSLNFVAEEGITCIGPTAPEGELTLWT